MARFSLRIKKSAVKELEAISRKKDRQRLIRRIKALADEPRPPGAEKLSSLKDRYRIRQGNFRVLHEIEDDQLIVYVIKVGDRKDVYRRGGP